MKFAGHKYWKRAGTCCEFVEVLTVFVDDGVVAELSLAVHTQSNRSWKTLISEFRHVVTKRDYHGWGAYTPRGEKIV